MAIYKYIAPCSLYYQLVTPQCSSICRWYRKLLTYMNNNDFFIKQHHHNHACSLLQYSCRLQNTTPHMSTLCSHTPAQAASVVWMLTQTIQCGIWIHLHCQSQWRLNKHSQTFIFIPCIRKTIRCKMLFAECGSRVEEHNAILTWSFIWNNRP